MKVLHINTSLAGGAALCAQRIMNATSQCGVETKMLVCTGEPRNNIYKVDPTSTIWGKHPLLLRIKNLLIKLNLGHDYATMRFHVERTFETTQCPRVYYHLPYSEYQNLAEHPLVKEADVIHLHWVTGMIDYPSFFRKVKKPIVWTMHDKYPLAGLQHYVSQYHPLPKELESFDIESRRIKRSSMLKADNLHLVAISKVMMDLCAESDVTAGLPAHLIHNGIDAEKFRHTDATTLSQELSIPEGNKVFMFSAFSIHDPNKGLSELIKALESLHRSDITLLCVGQYTEVPTSAIDIHCLGYVGDSNRLSQIYSLADYFIFPSFEESLGQTPIESMACGTPVVAFPTGIIPELINEQNGIICSDFTVEALADVIREAMEREYNREAIREDVVNRFSYDNIAQQYVELYDSLLRL